MIHVNFFTKKKVNILPLLVTLVFLAVAALIVFHLYDNHLYYNRLISRNNKWLTEHQDSFEISNQIKQLDQLTTQAVDVQESLRRNQYPMDILSENLSAFIPEEDNRVSSLHLSNATSQVSLIIENTSTDEALKIVENMEEQEYIKSVQLIRAESQLQDERLRFELIIDVDLRRLEVEDDD